MQELLVCPAVVDDLVGESSTERAVGSGADWNPFAALTAHRVVHAAIDVDDFEVLLLAHPCEIVRMASAAHTGISRAVAEHDHQLVVLQGEKVAAVRASAIGIRARSRNVRRAVRAVIVQATPVQVDKTVHHRIPHQA